MGNYVGKLEKENKSLIIVKNGKIIFTSKTHGMAPLLEAIEKIGVSQLAGSLVVDKALGKAAALLVCYIKAKEVYAKIMSVNARKLLTIFKIKYTAEKIIPEIMNKSGTDICPFEKAVLDINDPEEGYNKLEIISMRRKRG